MAHRQDSEQEAPVKDIRFFLDDISQVFRTAFNFLLENGITVLRSPRKQAFQHAELLASGMIVVIARHFVRERVTARECRGEDHASVIPQGVRKNPAILQLGPFRRGLVAHDQRYARIAQRIDAYGNRQLSVAVESRLAVGGNAELAFQVERTSTSRQLNHICHIGDGFECGPTVVTLHQPRNVLVEHRFAQARGDEIDELITAQNASQVRIVKDVLSAGQPQSRTGDNDWLVRRTMVWFTLNLPCTLEDLSEKVAEFSEMIAIRTRCLSNGGCGSLGDQYFRLGR